MKRIVLLLGVLRGSALPPAPTPVVVTLSEWKVQLSTEHVSAGPITFAVTNSGQIPHGFEVEGGGIERAIELIQPGATDTLTLTLKSGNYEVYCPVGDGSHQKLGMTTRLSVGDRDGGGGGATMSNPPIRTQAIRVAGGGAVLQILPGPFPLPDSAAPILAAFGAEREGLESQVKNGPYSNNVAVISGTFNFTAWDKGSTRDSVDGVATFTTQDRTRWRLVMDRVQTKDVPHHPRFGGVIMGLYYHGVTQVHTPLIPTINSAVALWAVGHLYRNDALVTDNAMIHAMLLSHTRREGDYALACWDCSKNTIDELQLEILPAPGEPQFAAPGGFLFVNWEHSSARKPS
jgi:hypothetical protein